MSPAAWILLFTVLFFAYRGARNGVVCTLIRLLSLVAGYVCAWLYALPLAHIIFTPAGFEGLLALAAAGAILFFGASLLVEAVATWGWKKLSDDSSRSASSYVMGGGLGAAIGVAVGLVLVWGVAFYQGLQQQQSVHVASDPIEQWAGRMMGQAFASAMLVANVDPQVQRATRGLAEQPQASMQSLQRVMQGEQLSQLLNDPYHQAVLSNADVDTLLTTPQFKALAENPDIVYLAERSGVIDTHNHVGIERPLAEKLVDMWGRARTVQNHERVQAIVNDPEFRQHLDNKQPWALMNDPRLMELTEIMLAAEPAHAHTPIQTSTSANVDADTAMTEQRSDASTEPESQVPTTIYRWVDEQGRVHYSDEPVETHSAQ